MCKIMEEVKAEGFEEGREEERELAIARALANARQKAVGMLKDGVLSIEKICEYTDLSLEEVKALAAAL